jgi:hypothetical protein
MRVAFVVYDDCDALDVFARLASTPCSLSEDTRAASE